jgi:uncharacterized membrane protein
MNTMFIKLYATALPMLFLLDLIWVGFVAKNLYAQQIGALMKPDINWLAAVLFYLIFVGALVFFVIAPAVERGMTGQVVGVQGMSALMQLVLTAAFFGLATYATYDLTNLALTKNWPLLITMVDLAWGVALSVIVSIATYFISTKFY